MRYVRLELHAFAHKAATVDVEYKPTSHPDGDTLKKLGEEVYELDMDHAWKEDEDWGLDMGTHSGVSLLSPPKDWSPRIQVAVDGTINILEGNQVAVEDIPGPNERPVTGRGEFFSSTYALTILGTEPHSEVLTKESLLELLKDNKAFVRLEFADMAEMMEEEILAELTDEEHELLKEPG